MVEAVREWHTGYLKAPTRSGKTVVAAGIISSYPTAKALFLVNTITLLQQTVSEFRRFLDRSIGTRGGGESRPGDVMVSTMQSFWKKLEKDPDEASLYDIVICDESHHCSTLDGTYAKILSLMPAPIRVGLTATPPKEGTEARLALEGFIGPQLEEISMEQGLASGILATPRMKFIKLEPDRKIRELRRYEDVYTEGIVRNKNRNRLILSEARQQIREGKTVLIVVLRLEHADELVSMGSAMGVLPVIVNGATEGDAREQLRLAMNRKEVNCVICTAVWREGVNIPSLGCLINAAGGKAEIMTIQVLGRGLTRTEGKDEGILIDVLDNSHPYLSSHAIERLCIYSSQGWL
jgi:superfamily II DNA or RNA helicase